MVKDKEEKAAKPEKAELINPGAEGGEPVTVTTVHAKAPEVVTEKVSYIPKPSNTPAAPDHSEEIAAGMQRELDRQEAQREAVRNVDLSGVGGTPFNPGNPDLTEED